MYGIVKTQIHFVFKVMGQVQLSKIINVHLKLVFSLNQLVWETQSDKICSGASEVFLAKAALGLHLALLCWHTPMTHSYWEFQESLDSHRFIFFCVVVALHFSFWCEMSSSKRSLLSLKSICSNFKFTVNSNYSTTVVVSAFIIPVWSLQRLVEKKTTAERHRGCLFVAFCYRSVVFPAGFTWRDSCLLEIVYPDMCRKTESQVWFAAESSLG